jgi:hypothetical protein
MDTVGVPNFGKAPGIEWRRPISYVFTGVNDFLYMVAALVEISILMRDDSGKLLIIGFK